MFGFCRTRLQSLVPSCTTICVDSSSTHFQKTPDLITSFSSTAKTVKRQSCPFAVSYLINTFGFSPELLSKRQPLYFKSPQKPDSVIKLLKYYGCSDALVSKIVHISPHLLGFDAQKTLLPKLEFFVSIGISGTALTKVLSTNPNVLTLNLERSLRPRYRMTKTLRIPDEKLAYFFSDFRRTIVAKLCILAGNTSILIAHGVPESSFPLWVPFYFNALSFDSEKVKENVKKVMSMGFLPSSPTFMKALYVISVTNASKWQQKMEFYRKWGMTEDDVLCAFKKNPLFMYFGEKTVSKKMDFYVNTMGFRPSFLAACPNLLSFSLEKRIIPWWSVIRFLLLEGLIAEETLCMSIILQRSKKVFLDKYVTKYQREIT